MQNERIKTEEHIEYDSDDTPESGETYICHDSGNTQMAKLQVTYICRVGLDQTSNRNLKTSIKT
jgi:hypothetical protein